jgi:hypothetical protein
MNQTFSNEFFKELSPRGLLGDQDSFSSERAVIGMTWMIYRSDQINVIDALSTLNLVLERLLAMESDSMQSIPPVIKAILRMGLFNKLSELIGQLQGDSLSAEGKRLVDQSSLTCCNVMHAAMLFGEESTSISQQLVLDVTVHMCKSGILDHITHRMQDTRIAIFLTHAWWCIAFNESSESTKEQTLNRLHIFESFLMRMLLDSPWAWFSLLQAIDSAILLTLSSQEFESVLGILVILISICLKRHKPYVLLARDSGEEGKPGRLTTRQWLHLMSKLENAIEAAKPDSFGPLLKSSLQITCTTFRIFLRACIAGKEVIFNGMSMSVVIDDSNRFNMDSKLRNN